VEELSLFLLCSEAYPMTTARAVVVASILAGKDFSGQEESFSCG
jgi:hypothetical protein